MCLKAAVLFASRSTEITTVTGEKIRGAGVNPMQIIDSGSTPVDKFSCKAMEMLNLVSLPREISEDIKGILDKMYACYNIYNKFEAIMNEIVFKPLSGKEGDCHDFNASLKVVGWLIFVLAKKSIPQFKDTLELIFLMAAVIHYLIYSLDNYAEVTLRSKLERRQKKESIIEFILSYLKIKDGNLLLRIQEALRNYLKEKLQPEVGTIEMRSFVNLASLQKKLDLHYQHLTNWNDIDERLFQANRKRNFSPKNQSPVKRYSNTLLSQVKVLERKLDLDADLQKTINFASKRVLDYERTVNFSRNSNFNELVGNYDVETIENDSESIY